MQRPDGLGLVERFQGGVGIPKIIMQTWKSHSVPDKWKASPLSIARWMPTWKYVLMSDADNDAFIALHFPHLLSWFRGLKYPIQRADVIRYAWLFIHGGVYGDLDIELLAPLDDLFSDRSMETWLLKAPHNALGHFTNFVMASTPRNKFWLHVLDTCQQPLPSWATLLAHHTISEQTGLGALTRAVRSWPHPIALLPQSFLVPCSYCDPDHCSKPYSYTRFLKGQSWCGWDTSVLNLFACKPEVVLLALMAAVTALWLRRRTRTPQLNAVPLR